MSNHDTYTDTHIRSVLQSVKSIAMIGASANSNRPSFFVAKYMIAAYLGLSTIGGVMAWRQRHRPDRN